MAASFGPRRTSVPAYTRQFQTLGPSAHLPSLDAGGLPETKPAGAIVPQIFEALEGMAGAAAGRGAPEDGPADWQEQLARTPTDAEDMTAFTRAMESAYLTDKETQISQRGEAIHADNAADLDGFNARWDNLETTVLDTLADPWKPMAKAELDRQRARYTQRIVGTIRANDENDFNGKLGSAADAYTARAAAAAHADDAEELAVVTARHALAIGSRTDLSPEQKAKAHSDFKAGVAAQAELGRLDGIIKDKGLEPADQYAADFKAGRAGGGKLAEAEREPIARLLKARLDDVRAEQRQAEAEKAAKAKSESERRLAAAEEAIATGRYGRHELERDIQTNRFADLPDAPARLSKAIEEARKARAAKAEAAARGAEAIAAGRDLAADDAGQADVDALWAAEKEADPSLGAARAIEIARHTRVLPRPAREAIADGLIYGTPEKRAEQARALVDLIKAAPAVAQTLPDQLRAEATRITKRLEQGHTPESATEGTDKALEGVNTTLMGGVGDDTLAAPADDATQTEPAATEPVIASDVDDDASSGYEDGDQLAMGQVSKLAVRLARPLFGAMPRQVVRAARDKGNHIREKLGKAARTLQDEGATLFPLEPIAELAAKRFEEAKRSSKSGRNRKAIFTPSDFGEGVTDDDAIQAFVEAHQADVVLQSPSHAAQLTIREVNPAFARRLKADTGVDITEPGYVHVLETGNISHAFRKHGPGIENDSRQVPISPEAMSVYLDVVENYDTVKPSRKKGAGDTVTFEKRVNGVVVVVQQVRSGKQEFAFFNMWIKKN